jgi:DNA-3-methyladenine glycosylase II
MTLTTTFEFEAPYRFLLSAAAEFYAGFTPMGGAAQAGGGRLKLGLLLDGSFTPVCVTLTQTGTRLQALLDGSDDVARVRSQLGRMLGLDADGRAWAQVGERDPVLGALQRQTPGFFTAGFPSPYEAGVQGVLSHRSSIAQGAALKRRLAQAHGTVLGGLAILPTPVQLLELREFPGLAAPKVNVLHGLARAALDGALDARRLRAMPIAQALESLQTLHGIGPWTAGHMLFRGASLQDGLPRNEPRVQRAFAVASERPEQDFEACAEAWRPFRMWACIALVRNLARVGQFSSPPEERAKRRRAALRVHPVLPGLGTGH